MTTCNQKTISAEKNAKTVKTIAAIFIAVCVIAFFLPVNYLVNGANGGIVTKKGMFISAFASMFGSGADILNFIPAQIESVIGYVAAIAVYGMFFGLLIAIVCAILALAKPQKAALYIKLAAIAFTWGVAIQSLVVLIVTSYLTSVKITVDITTCILAVVGAIFYFLLLKKEHKNAAFVVSFQFILSLVAVGFLFLALTLDGHIVKEAVRSDDVKLLLLLSGLAAMASLVLTSLLSVKVNKWTTILQLINVLAMMALSLCVALLSRVIRMSNYTYLLFSLLAAMTSFVQVLVCVYQFYVASKVEDNSLNDALASKFEKEEYVEVIPYTGDASKAQVAQLVEEPAQEAVEAPAEEEIADDPEKEALFEGKEDAFIATLSKAEKYEFADLYILKTKGAMAGIPTYEVGEENKAFFSKIFIYLSQYREKISSPLLAKIYDYAQKD